MRYPSEVNAYLFPPKEGVKAGIKLYGKEVWVPARPLGYASVWRRFRLAWMVFTGKADALRWPGQEG